jgi:hypothetical protein
MDFKIIIFEELGGLPPGLDIVQNAGFGGKRR